MRISKGLAMLGWMGLGMSIWAGLIFLWFYVQDVQQVKRDWHNIRFLSGMEGFKYDEELIEDFCDGNGISLTTFSRNSSYRNVYRQVQGEA